MEIYGEGGEILARLRNLSMTGAFFEVGAEAKQPRPRDLVRCKVHLPELAKVHTVDAEVVWNAETGFGVSFIKKEDLLEKMFHRGVG